VTEPSDFERAWLTKLSDCLDKLAGPETRRKVMAGSEDLSSTSDRAEVIAWSQQAMERLEMLVAERERREIMAGCACRYPPSLLQGIRARYQQARDIDQAIAMLQTQFVSFLRHTMQLDEELVEEIVGRGWGLAGVRQGDRIIATKIPKSEYLVRYLETTDPEVKRQLYCHCPRIRDILKSSETLSATYCYCGAGYYQAIWEEILQAPVAVEVLESVLAGGDVCRIAIRLPAGEVPD
jgi:hypothetical protein